MTSFPSRTRRRPSQRHRTRAVQILFFALAAMTFSNDGSGGTASHIERLEATGDVWPQSIAAGGDVVAVAGTFAGTGRFGRTARAKGKQDLFVAVYTADGLRLQWATGIGGPADDLGAKVVVAKDGSVFVAGSYQGSIRLPGLGTLEAISGIGGSSTDAFILGYRRDGHLLWARSIHASVLETVDRIAVDEAGNLLLVGSFKGELAVGCPPLVSPPAVVDSIPTKIPPPVGGQGAGFIVRLGGADGGCLSAQSLSFSPNLVAPLAGGGLAIAGVIAGGHSLVLAGDTLPRRGSRDAVLGLMSRENEWSWARRLGSPGGSAGVTFVSDMAVDRRGDLIVAGRAASGAVDLGKKQLGFPERDRLFVAKLSGKGDPLWSHTFTEGVGRTIAASVDEGSGDVIVAGAWETDASGQRVHPFISRLRGSSGAEAPFVPMSGAAYHPAVAVARGMAFLAGPFRGPLSLGTLSLRPSRKQAAFIAAIPLAP